MITIGGKNFTTEIIKQIGKIIEQEPDISRRQLSLRVCEILNWRNASGKLQDMSCRKILLELHRKSIIDLPELKRKYAFQRPTREIAPPPITPIQGSLKDLGELRLVEVKRGKLSPIWRSILDTYHYLRSGPLVGAQIRYLVHSQTCGWVSALSFSAAGLRVKDRDQWIGWSDQARSENIQRVVNNSRFLIPPMVRVKGLASHILSLAIKQLAQDWQARYAYQPVLVETYVERGRFQGSCYAGAGWWRVGCTSGRGRKESKKIIPKDIYLHPLCEHWKRELCTSAGQSPVVLEPQAEQPPGDWIEEEFGRAELGDRRLTARLLKMTGQFFEQPQANITQSSGSSHQAKAAYRFLDNPQVYWESILRSHYQATVDRFHGYETVLVATDTTTLNFTSHPATKGLGYICDRKGSQGIMVHDTMSFTTQGTPLGLLDVQCWIRSSLGSKHQRKEKPIEEKESFKWIQSYRAVCAAQKQCKATRLVMITDREGDIHELFCERLKHPGNAELLVRAERSGNCKVIDENENHDYLRNFLENQPVQATRKLLLPPIEERPCRQVELNVRSAKVTLKAPKNSKATAVELFAVYALEANPPEGVQAIEWMLLSTTTINTPSDALMQLQWYTKRWGIEVFHRILKSGCKVEQRQLESFDRICNSPAIDMVVAWRIFFLTLQGRKAPELACAIYFTENEWKALWTFINKTTTLPVAVPSLNLAIQLLGRLGGHLGRASDPPPGSEVLWRGMTRLADISEAYRLYR